jgi:hypothetical protein
MILPKLKQGKLFEYINKPTRSYYRTYKKTKLNIIRYPIEPLHLGVEWLATFYLHIVGVTR